MLFSRRQARNAGRPLNDSGKGSKPSALAVLVGKRSSRKIGPKRVGGKNRTVTTFDGLRCRERGGGMGCGLLTRDGKFQYLIVGFVEEGMEICLVAWVHATGRLEFREIPLDKVLRLTDRVLGDLGQEKVEEAVAKVDAWQTRRQEIRKRRRSSRGTAAVGSVCEDPECGRLLRTVRLNLQKAEVALVKADKVFPSTRLRE